MPGGAAERRGNRHGNRPRTRRAGRRRRDRADRRPADAGLPDYAAMIGPRCRAVWLLTAGAENIDPDDSASPAQAALAAMHRSVGFEFTDQTFGHLDLSGRGVDARTARAVVDVLLGEAAEVALRGSESPRRLRPNLPAVPRFGDQTSAGCRRAGQRGDHRRQRSHRPAVCAVLHRARGADGHAVEPQRYRPGRVAPAHRKPRHRGARPALRYHRSRPP